MRLGIGRSTELLPELSSRTKEILVSRSGVRTEPILREAKGLHYNIGGALWYSGIQIEGLAGGGG
jgi:hypothetical protein